MDLDPSSLPEWPLSRSPTSLTHTHFSQTTTNLLKNKHKNSPICHEHLAKLNPTVSLSYYSCHRLGMQSLVPQSPILWLQPLGVPASSPPLPPVLCPCAVTNKMHEIPVSQPTNIAFFSGVGPIRYPYLLILLISANIQ